MDLKIAISPCPNDTFIFAPIILGLIDTGPYNCTFEYADIDVLNDWSLKRSYSLIKMSYYHYLRLKPDYNALSCGGALGYNCGPLLISNDIERFLKKDIPLIAIPGLNTTANFLLKFYMPDAQNIKVMRFDLIEKAIQDGEVDAGVIIHEGRFTYKEKNLELIQDLGEYWQDKTKFPIPLGCIGLHTNFSGHDQKQIADLIRMSIVYAEGHFDEILPFIQSHAQEMKLSVIKDHINLYVNHFTYNIELQGKLAIEKMQMEIERQYSS